MPEPAGKPEHAPEPEGEPCPECGGVAQHWGNCSRFAAPAGEGEIKIGRESFRPNGLGWERWIDGEYIEKIVDTTTIQDLDTLFGLRWNRGVELRALTEENERLRGALEPFSDAYRIRGLNGFIRQAPVVDLPSGHHLSVDDFRNAFMALGGDANKKYEGAPYVTKDGLLIDSAAALAGGEKDATR